MCESTIHRYVLFGILVCAQTCLGSDSFTLTSSNIAYRKDATATLLQDGRVVMVGGFGSGPSTSDGLKTVEIFDPKTGLWTAGPDMSFARGNHTATLLEDGRLLVTGGATSSDGAALYSTNTAEIYDPLRNMWKTLATTWVSREHHRAVRLGNGKVLITGGQSGSGPALIGATVFDPLTVTFSSASSLHTARSKHSMTLLTDGSVLVAGGGTSQCEIYSPADDTWTVTGALPNSLTDHSAVALRDGSVLVINTATSGAFRYSPATKTWGNTGSVPFYVSNPTLNLLPDGRALLTGGQFTVGHDSLLFDPVAGTWSEAPAMNVSHARHTATLLTTGEVLIAGGTSGRTSGLFRFGSEAWTAVPALPAAARSGAASPLSDGRVLVSGGTGVGGVMGSSFVFNPVTASWATVGDMVTARSGHRLTLIPGGKVLATGGVGADAAPLAVAELFDPVTGTWSATGSLADARTLHTATAKLDGKILVTGGQGVSGLLASVESYDPLTGVWTTGLPLPSARAEHAAVLRADGYVHVSGGTDAAGPIATCLLYNPPGANWLSAQALPSARKGHSATLLPSGAVLICGGMSSSGPLASCYSILPSQALWQSLPNLDEARTCHSATLLASGQVLVVGGTGATGLLGSAERYDPATTRWTASPSLATARAEHIAVVLPNQTLLLAGGVTDASTPTADTQIYDEGHPLLEADRPVITSLPSTASTTEKLVVVGTGLVSPTSPGGGCSRDAAAVQPVIQLRHLSTGRMLWLRMSPFTRPTATTLTSWYPGDFPPGPTMATVFRDGLPSLGKTLEITEGTSFARGEIIGPDGTSIEEGVSVVDFGPATIGGPSVRKVFQVRNTGTESFVTSGIAGDPGMAANGFLFTVNVPEIKILAPGSSAQILVDFSATKSGSVIGDWFLLDNQFQSSHVTPKVTVTGSGYTFGVPGTIAFASSEIRVNEEAGTVLVPLTRTLGRTGAVTVKLSSSFGTAQGSDFTPVAGLLVTFADNETTKLVPISIAADSIDEPNETFTLTLSSPSGGAKLGSPSKATVRIIEPNDSIPPTLTLTSPTDGSTVADGAAKLVGSAHDNRTVGKVQYSFNGASFRDIPVTLASNGLSATFAAKILPAAGPNVVTVRTLDTRGNASSSIQRSFFYSALRPLVVSAITGQGAITAPFPGTASRIVGKRYTLTATPKPGYLFTAWSANVTTGTGLTLDALQVPTISFVHQEGLRLSAYFASDPYVPGTTGIFSGLVTPSPTEPSPRGTVPGNDTFGGFSATISSRGAFTGSLKLDGATHAITGVFDFQGVARFGANRSRSLLINRPGKPALELALADDVDLFRSTHKITGTVIRRYRGVIDAVSLVEADLGINGITSSPPESLTGTSSKRYTFALIPRSSQASGLTPADYPSGDGYAAGTMAYNGNVSFIGRLADNTAITVSTKLSVNLSWPLYAQLYGLKGSYGGRIVMNDAPTQTDTDMQGSGLLWFRPYQVVQWYPYGWPEGLVLDLKGAKYVRTVDESVLPGLAPPDFVTGNATLTFTGGLLPSTAVSHLLISSDNGVAPATPAGVLSTLKLEAQTGLISGTFAHPLNATTPFNGVVLQKGSAPHATGFFMSPSPKTFDYLGQAGKVDLRAK